MRFSRRWPLDLGWPRKLSSHVYLLGTYHFNVYLVEGEYCALVEAGMGCSSPLVISQLDQLGITRERVKYLLAMHAHPDHVTGIPLLVAALPGATVVASKQTKEILASEKVRQAFFREDKEMGEILLERGEITQLPVFPGIPEEIPVHVTVGEGDFLELGRGVKLRIHHTPGHSTCSLSAYLPGDRALFISDAAGFVSASNLIFPVFFSSYRLYMDSIARLKNMPAEILCLPHECYFVGSKEVGEFLTLAEKEAEKMHAEVKCWLEKGLAEEEIAGKIFARQYRGSLRVYTQRNIQRCVKMLIKQAREDVPLAECER